MRLEKRVALIAPRRTPIGRLAGALAGVEPHGLLAQALTATVEAADDVGARDVDDVIVGCVRNGLGNVARLGALAAGLGEDIPAQTVDRQCASSMEALATAAAKIRAGLASKILVGGVESASRCPWFLEKTRRPYAYAEPRPYPIRLAPVPIDDPSMGETAEILADEFGIGREEMDRLALRSHQRAAAARERGDLDWETTPVEVSLGRRGTVVVDSDEGVRTDTSLEALGELPPVFRRDGRVTAGNASQLSDGAAACLVTDRSQAEGLGLTPDAWLAGVSCVALEPRRMGMGPALAIPRLLGAVGLEPSDVDLFEINEAFAAQVLAVNRVLEIPDEKLNVHGGAVAVGHPLGATGLRLVVSLIGALRARDLRRGVAALCVGGGQGMAVLVER